MIKLFEKFVKTRFKFEIGNYVKCSYNNKIYIIENSHIYDDSTHISYYISDTNNRDTRFWMREDELTLIPDYEIDAEKYNL